jgi:hypothetical protein
MDNENGYIVSGRTLLSTWYPWLVRTDKSGTLLWSYTYNLPGIDEHFLDVTDTYWSEKALFATVGQADGDPAIGTGMDDYFLMVDGSGMPVVAKRFLTSGADLARHLEPIKHPKFGEGYVITGQTNMSPVFENDIHVIITDKTGTMMNSAVYLHANAQISRWIEPTKDGGFVVTGETVIPHSCDNDKVNIFVLRLDQDLKVLWNRTFDLVPPDGNSEDRAYVIKETDDGDLHLSGTSRIIINNVYHSEPFQLHMKSDGSPVWLKAYQVDSYKDAEAVSMLDTRLDDGSVGYVLSGRSYSPFDALLFKTDNSGNVLWGRTYPSNISLNTTFAEDVTDNKLKGYSFVGRTFNGVAPPTAYDIHIMEGDENGKSDQPCEKEVRISEKEWRFCEDRLNLQETIRMREIKIDPKVEKLPLQAYKCTEFATSSLERSSGTLSPNPAGTSVSVTGFEGTGEVLIYDLQGVLRKKLTQSLTTEVNVADLPTGLYIVKVKDASGTIHEFRFVKE